MTFRIAQISDSHLSETRPLFVENFVRIGEALRASRPDLVLNTGDVSLDGVAQEGDLGAARLLHDALGLPLRFLPGNHDLGDAQDAPGHGESTIDAERRARYVRHFGPDWWWFDIPGWRILGLNAQLLGSDLAAAADQERAIGEAMAGLGLRSLALCLHKPLFDQSPEDGEVTGRFLTPAARRQLLDRLGLEPTLVISGHVHQFRVTTPGTSCHVWAPSTAFVLPDRIQPLYGLKRVGYVEHSLEADGTHRSAMIEVAGAPTQDVTDFPRLYGPG